MSGLAALPMAGAGLDGDVGLDHTPVIQDQRVGDQGIGRLATGPLALAHAIADHFATAKLHLFAVAGEILLHLDPQLGVAEAQPVAHGGAVHIGVGASIELAHGVPPWLSGPITSPRKP